MTVDAVLFDLDDTLYPYGPCNEAGKAAARATASEGGYEFAADPDTFEAFYQRGRHGAKRDVAGTAASHHRLLYFKYALEAETGEPQPEDALALADAYWDGYLEAMSLESDVLATLETLRNDGISLAIITNLTTRIQLRKLTALGLEDAFDLVLTSEEAGQEKPASVMFTLPLARLECPPSRAMVVGDSVPADIVGANAIGLESVLYCAGDDPDVTALSPHETPDHHLQAFGELTDLVR
ncbi:HAD family hydrolase [Natrialbaceae archaeon A-chndr2]